VSGRISYLLAACSHLFFARLWRDIGVEAGDSGRAA